MPIQSLTMICGPVGLPRNFRSDGRENLVKIWPRCPRDAELITADCKCDRDVRLGVEEAMVKAGRCRAYQGGGSRE
jgi:hypothetical protein